MRCNSFKPDTSFPSIHNLPELGLSSNPRIVSKVVFPHPEGPKTETNSPFSIARLTLLNAVVSTSAAINVRVKAILEELNIIHRHRNYPRQLSGGQQQQVAIARAIVTKPDIILADEPTGNLDSVSGTEIMNLLTKLNNMGTTIIMVTHSPSQADKAHRTIQLFDGHIVTKNIHKTMETG